MYTLYLGLEPKGFRCPIPKCEDPNNTTFSAIDENWLFPKSSANNDYDYCNPYKFNYSAINSEECTEKDFTKETEEFDVNRCSDRQIRISLNHI